MGSRSPTYLVQSETKGPTGIARGLATFIGIAEPTGDLGVILPMATSFAPWPTARTAVGLATIMLLAIGFHVRHHESPAAAAIFLKGPVLVLRRFFHWT